mgnify:FL=1
MSEEADYGSDADQSPMRPTNPPDAYPVELEQWVAVGEGYQVFVRPIIPEDVARLRYAFDHADIETLRRRFFTAAPPMDRSHLEYLAGVDYDLRLALLAMDCDGVSVGIGRYEQIADGLAEVAIVVAPQWRRRRVGTVLLELLEPVAAAHGITTLKALYLPDNRAVEELLAAIGYGGRHVVDGIVEVTKPIG